MGGAKTGPQMYQQNKYLRFFKNLVLKRRVLKKQAS